MTVTTSPGHPRTMLDGTTRDVVSVAVDCVVVGVIERDRHGDWGWRLPSMISATPAAFGLRMNAIAELVHAAGLPSGWRRRVPDRLLIAGAAEGAGEE